MVLLSELGLPPYPALLTSLSITWRLINEDPTKFNLSLHIVNIDVRQDIPPPTASSTSSSSPPATPSTPSAATTTARSSVITAIALASLTRFPTSASSAFTGAFTSLAPPAVRRMTLEINGTLDASHRANVAFYDDLNFPEGRYYVYGMALDGRGTAATSEVFSVVEGNDTSCLAAFASLRSTATVASSTRVSASTSASTSRSTSASPTGTVTAEGANGGTDTSSRSGLAGGAIAGVVVGILAVVALAGLVAWVCFRRRRRDLAGSSRGPEMSQGYCSKTFAVNRRGSGTRHMQMPSGTTSLDGAGPTPIAMSTTPRDEEKDDNASIASFGASPRLFAQQSSSSSSRPVHDPFATAPKTPRANFEADMSDFNPNDNRRFSTATAPGSFPPVMTARSRSESGPSNGRSGGLGRVTSSKRKPVPSLGAELRSELQRKPSDSEAARQSFQLVPDPPRSQE